MLTVRLALLLFTLSLNLGALLAQSAPDATVHIDTTPSHQINSFDPDYALGSSLDVLSRRDIDRVHTRSEEHTSELQSRLHLVCRLLLEKKKYIYQPRSTTTTRRPYSPQPRDAH